MEPRARRDDERDGVLELRPRARPSPASQAQSALSPSEASWHAMPREAGRLTRRQVRICVQAQGAGTMTDRPILERINELAHEEEALWLRALCA